MTVSAQIPINRSTGNGVTTVFAYNFKVLSAADMEVSVDGVVKTLNTDYTLSGVGSDSGNVTFLVAPAIDTVVVRRRNMAYTRSVDYQDQGELPTDTLDDDQDAAVLMIQQLDEELGRSIRVAPDSSGVDLELPAPVPLTYLRWNSLANALENVLLADISLISLTAYAQTFLNAVDAAAARLVLGATTVGNALFTAAGAAEARTAISAAPTDAATTTASGLVELATTAETQTGTDAARVITPAGLKAALGFSSTVTLALQTLTSGTSKEWTNVAGLTEIDLSILAASLASADYFIIQLGTASAYEITGYAGGSSTNGQSANNVTGFIVEARADASSAFSGNVKLKLHDVSTNKWTISGGVYSTNGDTFVCGGDKALAGPLTRIRITSISASTLDGGSASGTGR